MEKRYYYKTIDSKNFLNLKNPIDISKPINGLEYVSITEQEFNELTKHKEFTPEQKVLMEKRKLIAQKKSLLIKYREDIEQVDLFGMHRDDYDQKKQLCIQLVLELRELERG